MWVSPEAAPAVQTIGTLESMAILGPATIHRVSCLTPGFRSWTILGTRTRLMATERPPLRWSSVSTATVRAYRRRLRRRSARAFQVHPDVWEDRMAVLQFLRALQTSTPSIQYLT